MLYSRNTFHVGDRPEDANYSLAWLDRIGPENAKLIRSVSIDIYKCKTESRLLPFLVFLFELRSAATNLQELSIWLGPKVQQNRTSHARSLVREMERFKHLKKLILAGNYAPWWSDYLSTKFDSADGNVSIELVALDSPAWKERIDRRAHSSRKISEQADLLRGTWNRAKMGTGDWAEPMAREMWVWRMLEKGKWREMCECSDCRGMIAAELNKRVETVLNSRADIEMENRKIFCECNDCAWVRENGRATDKSLSCFEIHERVANGSLRKTQEENVPELLRQEYPVAKRAHQVSYERREPPADSSKLPVSTIDASLGATFDSAVALPVKPTAIAQAAQLETLTIISRIQYESPVERTLRRERRRWYGRSP